MSSRTVKARYRGNSGCSGSVRFQRPRDLAAIVRAYEARHRSRSQAELASFAAEPTLEAAVRRAGLAQRKNGKRYDHQRRLPRAVLQAASAALTHARLADAGNFDNLQCLVQNAIGRIQGVGRLTVYDTTLRIGAKLGLAPQGVYLHSGTRRGARAIGLDWRASVLSVAECPSELRRLRPHEIEDCLCIFKDQFDTIRVKTSRV